MLMIVSKLQTGFISLGYPPKPALMQAHSAKLFPVESLIRKVVSPYKRLSKNLIEFYSIRRFLSSQMARNERKSNKLNQC